MDKGRILFVEDDPALVELVRFHLAREGYQVLQTADGDEALLLAQETPPDLVLLDWMIEGTSGIEVCRQLRRLPGTKPVPIIMMTARGEETDRVRGLETGADDYVTKPFSPRELLARIEAQLRLREAAVRAAENERLAATGLLTSGFAHEVRNPLNGLMNAMLPLKDAVLGEKSDPETAKAMLEVIEECGTRIRYLAESLLAFVRSNDRPVAVNLDTLLDSTLNVLAWKVPSGVTIEKDYRCNLPVMGDPGSLNQVWVNLLDNALRAVGERGRLKVSTELQGETAVVSVVDSGVGIKQEDMDRLFQPFFSTRAAGEGTGLGLALCRRIVLRHGGSINISSEYGKGTKVEVRLPLNSLESPQSARGPARRLG